MKQQRTLFLFLSIGNGKKSRMETVTGKVILDIASVSFASNAGKSVTSTSHLTIRRLQKIEQHSRVVIENFILSRNAPHSGQKCLNSISDHVLRESLTIKPLQNMDENEYAANLVWFLGKTDDSVVILHVSTARIPRKWLLSIFLSL